jgi:hypothetical protein
MILLYCSNGVVLTTHDDVQAVLASAYGSGVRIIPWDQPLGALDKVGPAPNPGVSDARPYAQPAETPAILKMYAAQRRYDCSVGGISFTAASGTIPVNTGRGDGALINNLAAHAQSLQPADPLNFTQDNVLYPITAQEAIDMFHALMTHIQDCRNIEANCITDLDSATPTLLTYDDVDAQFAGVAAKTLAGRKTA